MSFTKGNTLGFKPGNTLAKENNNQKKKRIRRSELRKTLAALKALEPKAIANIEKSINEQEIDKESLATSRWLVNSVVTITKAATQEEATLNGLRIEMDKLEEDAQEEETEVKSKFSLTVLPTKKDL